MASIQRFDFVEVGQYESLIFPEKLVCLGSSSSSDRLQERENKRSSDFCRPDNATGPWGSRSKQEDNVTSSIPALMALSRRESLQVKIDQVAYSLAPIEKTVLESIVEQGDDAQVQFAQEQLQKTFPQNTPKTLGTRCSDEPSKVGSAARRTSLRIRQRNNTTHVAMFKTASKIILDLNKHMGHSRVQSLMEKRDAFVTREVINVLDEIKRCNRRTSTPAEMKEIALLAIQAAKEEGWLEGENDENDYNTFPCKSPITTTSSEGGSSYDPWARVDEDFTGIHFDFSILGTSADDKASSPHVLSPPLMHRLQEALPLCKRGEAFWLKYSLVRDGASLSTFMNNVRSSRYSIMAIETVDGEVFGAFVAEPWHFDPNFYGTVESFVWKMRHHRGEISDSIAEQARKESDIEIFRYSFENRMIQLCQSHPVRLAVGGGSCPCSQALGGGKMIESHQWGFAISFDDDCLLEGTSSPCITFRSPSLSDKHSDGSRFEILNLEVWALTPCLSVEEAEIIECNVAFLQRNIRF